MEAGIANLASVGNNWQYARLNVGKAVGISADAEAYVRLDFSSADAERTETYFDTLAGYEAAVGETARLTATRRELDAQEAEELNRQLAAIISHLSERPKVTVEYFVPDERKTGGAYVTVSGRVRHISVPEKTLVMEDGTVIPMEDVVSTTGEIFSPV